MIKSISFCFSLVIIVLLTIQHVHHVHCNIVLQDKKQNHLVLTDHNIVLKGDFFGDQCQNGHTHSVEHIWLPMPHHKEEHHKQEHHKHDHWEESRQSLNYASPERRFSQQQNLNKMLLMLAQSRANEQQIENRFSEVDTSDEHINRAFEKHMFKLRNEIEDD